MSKAWFVTGAGRGNRCRHVVLMMTCPSRRMESSDEHAKPCHLDWYDSTGLQWEASNHEALNRKEN
jgi:hypothetical protein